jgi:hypothetical protein
LAGHLVAVQRRNHGGAFTGDIDQDGCGRATVLRTVIDASQHDEGADRIEPEGDWQQHGDGSDCADARQNADEGADKASEESQP